MLATVDLNQFADAGSARSRLLDFWRPQPPWQPQTAGSHHGSDGLDRQLDAMALSELLSSQSWSKIGVLSTDDGEGFLGTLWLYASIAGSISKLGDETTRTLQFVTLNQPPNLAHRQPKTLGDGFLLEMLVD
jgi:hypothetical protein